MRSSENSKDNPSNHMLFFVFALLVLASGLQAQYVVEDADGCVDIAVEVPAPFTILRVDRTDYEFDGEEWCAKSWDKTDVIPCGVTEVDGAFTATARVCDVEQHSWLGFRMDQHMQNGRYAYVTVYFSHGGTWEGIEEKSKTEDDVHILSTTFMKPKDEDQSWVFCSTLDAYLSYKVIWA